MKALILQRPKECSIQEIERPVLQEDEVLIRIKASGICTNDIRDFNGDCSYSFPRIGGHEYCGVIEALGNGVNSHRFVIGQKVVSYIIENCHECEYCKRGEENICEALPYTKVFQNPGGISGYGGFAEFVKTKAGNLFVFPEKTPFETMAFTEPLACVINSVNQADIKLGDDVLVIGGGTMGLLHVMVARQRGARVIVSEPMAARRKKALALGCQEAFDPTTGNAVKKVEVLTGGAGAKVVFNTTAHPKIAAQAITMTAPGGICIMFSSIHPNDPVPLNAGIVHSYQKTVTGAVSPTRQSYHQAVLMLGKGLLDPLPLLEAVLDYTEFDKAMALAMRPDTYKVLLGFGVL